AVQPTTGNLAPNTQYQVTIGPNAKTASGQLLSTPKTITFVTQPPPAPSPSPTPVVTPSPRSSALTGQQQLATVPGGVSRVQWSPDSSTVYFVTAKGGLESVPAAGGSVTVIAPDGVTAAGLVSAGDRIAYVRNGKIQVLTLRSSTTTEIISDATPVIVGWAKDAVEWTTADSVFTSSAGGPAKVSSLPTSGTITAISFSPDGTHLAYAQDQNLQVLDLATGKSSTLGLAGAQFLGWSPDSTGVMYSGAQGVIVADVAGRTTATLPAGDPSWSNQDEVLLGSDTDIWEVRPDGTGQPVKLAEGTYHAPVWAPNGVAFTYVRGGALFVASAPAAPARASAIDAAAAVVKAFMDARSAKLVDKATSYLDDNGKKAYSGTNGGLNLLVTGDPSFSRSYVLTQEITGTQPDTAQFVVRIVLSHEKLDVSTFEETLTLVRSQGSQQFLIDQASSGPVLSLGKGAAVVSVDVASASVKVTFDSDLQPDTVPAGVIILDAKGKQVGATPVYANRTVTIMGLDLKSHSTYKLVVLSTVKDVGGNNIASEYDLTFSGPSDLHGDDRRRTQSPSPSPQASPGATPSS
ncbi:MAG TPA: Ig-like domain-containing protein, partial [Candidatus Dormibacteraeota bacterium]|nr:Ig-like domain-containing protein [Candidatus Dormibacteraeota bacterium]